ncbi:MAG: class I SAM-dependent methyltransferase [Candidatus Binatia bacterium]
MATAEPRTRGLAIDDRQTTLLRREIIREKPFLRRIYDEWYQAIVDNLPPGGGAVLEIGSGAGFLAAYVPDAITSDVFILPDLKLVLDGRCLPLRAGTLRAVVMTDAFHHIPSSVPFLREAARCVRPGGAMVMIEPWVTSWSKLVYGRLHHEPFDPRAPRWEFPQSGPLSGGNSALPWIVFERDAETFAERFPEWKLKQKRPSMPFRYLVSGGVSQRAMAPAFTFEWWRTIERLLEPAMARLAMFATIVLERV